MSQTVSLCPKCQSTYTQLPLTKRQAEMKAFLAEWKLQYGRAPSFEEIAQHFGFRSLATVYEHLDNLTRKGHIIRQHHGPYSIQIVAVPA